MLQARDKAQRQARQENARKAWGQRGDGAAPATGLESSQGEGSSADCPVCWGECSHRYFLTGLLCYALLILLKGDCSLSCPGTCQAST